MSSEWPVGPGLIFTLFFVTLGPLKVIGPFAHRTQDRDQAAIRQIATRAFLVATVAVIVGSVGGKFLMLNWQVSVAAMALAGGIIFFLVALRQLLEQYEPPRMGPPEPLPASPMAAALRLLFPTVLTPYGIAVVITLLVRSDSLDRTATILGLLLLVMVLNLLAMVYARRILAAPGVPVVLQVVGAVLAVLQVALATQFILEGLRMLGAAASL
jgi:multiple antibiotic resistance protein